MGIVDELLAEFELSSLGYCRIEQDVNGTVHMHLGSFRIEMSADEFDQFVEVIEESQRQLHRRKEFDEL